MKIRLLSPAALILVPAITGALGASVAAAAPATTISPGRVMFSVSNGSQWKFGARGERDLLERGGIVVSSSRPGNPLLDERVRATKGDLSPLRGAHEGLYEGAINGVRYPSLDPDDDHDGRVNEDVADGIDNDRDGKIDEDFAAIGDEMAVIMAASRDGDITLRHEMYGWSLPNIDGMIASTLEVTNSSARVLPHARIGVELDAIPGLELADGPSIDGMGNATADAAFVQRCVVLDDDDHGLAALFFVQRSAVTTGPTSAISWEIHGDRNRVTIVSPDLGDLAPGASATIYLALVALPADDLKAARAIRNAQRTVVGDGTAQFIPPPVSLLARNDLDSNPHNVNQGVVRENGRDIFWSTAGKLQESLLRGSPNPFHDTVSIDYQIPFRVVDEEGVEHVLDSDQPTSVKIYNVAGRLVATLLDEAQSPGKYRVGWTARAEDGGSLASGVYYVKLQIGKRSVTMRMVQLK